MYGQIFDKISVCVSGSVCVSTCLLVYPFVCSYGACRCAFSQCASQQLEKLLLHHHQLDLHTIQPCAHKHSCFLPHTHPPSLSHKVEILKSQLCSHCIRKLSRKLTSENICQCGT